jgi:sigma-54 dependent transcriptional regulator, acetoin dehydrogenase operon transcriptional activator AcoR
MTVGSEPAVGSNMVKEPVLILAMESMRPNAGSFRLRLSGLSAVTVGRGSAQHCGIEEQAQGRCAIIKVPDKWMSSAHARIESSFERWVLVDCESKNGCMVDGHSTKRSVLTDGALIELGHTLFWFFESFAMPADAPVIAATSHLLASSAQSSAVMVRSLLPSWEQELQRLDTVAVSDLPIWFHGDEGVGTRPLAERVHAASGLQGTFQVLSCASLAAGTHDAAIFGSNAMRGTEGCLHTTIGGTIVFDQIELLPVATQEQLLRAIVNRQYFAPLVGSSQPLQSRIMVTSDEDPDDLVADGKLLANMVVQLASFRVHVPNVAQRKADLGTLIGQQFTETFATPVPRPETPSIRETAPHRLPPGLPSIVHPGFDIEAARALLKYSWPFNLPEISKALKAAAALAAQSPVAFAYLPESIQTGRSPGSPRPVILSEIDQQIRDDLYASMREHQGNLSAVARALQKDRKQIQRWVKRFAIDPDSFKG